MSSAIDVPAQLALAILLATGIVPRGTPSFERSAAQALDRTRASTGFGFTDESWLAMLYAHGEAAGQQALARRIFRTSSGRFYVPVDDDRRAIRALQRNPALAERIVAASAEASAEALKAKLGRTATLSEIYAAHVLGVEPAAGLIASAALAPRRLAIEVLPAAALQHADLFFNDTRPRTTGALLEALSVAFEKSVRAELASRRAATATAASPAPIQVLRANAQASGSATR